MDTCEESGGGDETKIKTLLVQFYVVLDTLF